MSTFLSELLGAKEPLFTMGVKQLEEASGRTGADVRLIAEIIEKTTRKTKELGLDPKDTTGEELYHALNNLVRMHDEHIAKRIGALDHADAATMMPLIKKAIDSYKMPKRAWVLKKSSAKKLLQAMPPPAIMKHLRHSSLDSMLKRENLLEVYGALRFVESPAWLTKFIKSYKALQPSDFESRDIEIVIMDKERWGDMAEDFVRKNCHNITHLKEMGAVYMLPTKLERLPGVTLCTLSLAFHYINEIRLYSSFFKLQQVKPTFGRVIAETLVSDGGNAAVMAGSPVHWRIIQRYYGNISDKRHPEIFEPHVQPEDLHWRKAEEHLFKLDPEFGFWKGLDFVAVLSGGKPISFNLIDVIMSFTTQADFKNRLYTHARESLWNELYVRYMGEANLESQILSQLDMHMTTPEKLKI